ncbi:MAG: FAD/NAD(P)-binding oxidoreductase [Thermodesulfovibrionales bacterium]|nr:FAD/NAD(P)-binding oxidoreductase [Thermodesulfovibrionales bacterium]
MAKIVILGGSFGGLTAAFELKRLLGKKAEVTIVSDDDRFVFLPSLPWLIMGWRKPSDITLSVPEILKPKGIQFVHEAVINVDADSSKVRTATKEISYDYLVISTGPYLSFDEIPGLGPDKGYTDCTFTLDHGTKTHESLEKVFESPGPVVLGSSQMVSCFGPSYELAFEIDAELRRRKMRHKVPIIYLTSEPYLGHMGVGGLGNSKRFFEDEFAVRDIKSVVNQAIEEVTPGEIKLKDGTKIPFKMAMVAPPFKGVPAVAPLGNPRGFIPVDKNYRHTKHKNIFTIGVAVAIAPPEATPVPTGVPKTGFMTVKMAKAAAATIFADIKGSPPPPANDLDVICIMDMGNTAAYMKAVPVLPPRQASVTKKGVWAKWLKVAFEKYFLWKMKNGMSNLP